MLTRNRRGGLSARRFVALIMGLAVVALTVSVSLAWSSTSPTTLTLDGHILSGNSRMSSGDPYYAIPNPDPCLPTGGTKIVFDGSASSVTLPDGFGTGSLVFMGAVTVGPLTEDGAVDYGDVSSLDSFTLSMSSAAGSATVALTGPSTGLVRGSCGDWDHTDARSHFTGDKWADTTGWYRFIGFVGTASYPYEAIISGTDGSPVIERGTVRWGCTGWQARWSPTSSGAAEACTIDFSATSREASDDVPPVVTGVPDRSPNGAGWFSADVTVDWQAVDPDPSSGTPSDPPDTVASTEGANVAYTSDESCDPAGNCATGQISLSIDETAPTVGVPGFSVNPKGIGESTELTATADDGLSGVVGGEYYLDTDPGEGNATAMIYGSGSLSATIGDGLAAGVYQVCVRALDAADNWSGPACAFLVVYDPSAGFATGGGWFVPGGKTSDPGDLLPGLDSTSKANFGFVVKYQNGASTQPGGQLEFHYNVGDFHLHSTGMEWLVVTNNNWAKFQGMASIDGATGEYPFRVDARDGSPDRFIIKIWAPGANRDTDEPIYKASGDVEGGQVKIHRS